MLCEGTEHDELHPSSALPPTPLPSRLLSVLGLLWSHVGLPQVGSSLGAWLLKHCLQLDRWVGGMAWLGGQAGRLVGGWLGEWGRRVV